MGRSRAASRQHDDYPNKRSKRKRNSNAENLETSSTVLGIREGKASLYHCNYCNKDISGKVRIKCAVCQDFDLCIECFSVGAELTPHKSNHPYRVMDNLSFPLICLDWSADEEMLLLEGIEMYGFGNWTQVAEYIGTKSKSQCIDHYNAVYMNSPCFPLPDLYHIMGKSREELLAMAKEPGEIKKEYPPTGDLTLKEEPPNFQEAKIKEPANKKLSSSTSGTGKGSVCGKTYSNAIKKTSNKSSTNDGVKDESTGEMKLKLFGEDGPSLIELSGYNFKRGEFEIEYDNDAEQILADMEFKDSDTEAEHELKLQVLHIYSRRLDERKRRKNFILERNLLYPDPFENSLSPEERQICQRYKVFMRFHSKEEHMELLKSIIEEHRLVKRIQDLQEARAAGCRTSAEAHIYIDQKRSKEAKQSASRESGQAGCMGGKTLPKSNNLKKELDDSHRGVHKVTASPFSGSKESLKTTQALSTSLDDWDVTGFPGVESLSESEKKLCSEIRILPSHYLNMLQVMSIEIWKGRVTKKSDAHTLFKVEQSKVDRIYDMLVKKGIAQA
ncbi:hypothetical protein L6164_031573 [Bauhinia variegata]|uniref:Uncharacterized protein n=1 Tax=Bauhinia variegata TaxID=167791 RepID=A0ACB9LFW4_BAUVA|nr:hypothetical protein L6164_031573 [Bauhinia variegata]